MTQTHEETGQHAGRGPHANQEAYRGLWQWGQGYPDEEYCLSVIHLPQLREGTCSAPTSDAAKPYDWFYWKFVATESGWLSFDAVESFIDDIDDLDPDAIPEVEITIWENQGSDADPYWNDIDNANDYYDDTRDIWIYRGRLFTEVVKGKTYVLGLRQTYTPGLYTPANLVLRIGDEYVSWSDYIQPPDQTIVWGGAGNKVPSKAIEPNSSQDKLAQYWIQEDMYGGEVLEWASGFEGKFRLSRTFGGPYPATDQAAIDCTWRWSRVLQAGWAWWDDAAPYTGPGQINDWFGWAGGPGVCPTFGAGDYDSDQGYYDHPVGYTYSSDSPNQYQECGFRVFATAQVIRLAAVENLLTETGTATYSPSYLPNFGRYDQWEWEPETPYNEETGQGGGVGTCKLVKVELAPDQLNGGGTARGEAVTTKWYLEAAKLDEEIVGRWGPKRYNGNTSWSGGPQGPESFVGTQTHLADYNGGDAPWQEVPESIWKPALERERNPDYNQNPGHALRVTGLPDGIFTNTIPSAFNETLLGAMGVNYYHYRQWQFVALRTTVRPVRYRVLLDPGLPDVTWKRRGSEGEGLTDGRIFR